MKLPQITDEMLYGIMGLCLLYLVAMYILQKTKVAAQNKSVKKAKAQLDEARVLLEEEKRKLIDSISLIYGLEQSNYVAMGKIWVGMPMSLLMVAKGKANNIKQSMGVDQVIQTWQYSAADKVTGRMKEKLEVTLVNNEVSTWKEFA